MDVVSDYRCPTKRLGTLSTLCSGYYTEKEDGCGGWMVQSWRMNGTWDDEDEDMEEVIDDLTEVGWHLPGSLLDERRLFGVEDDVQGRVDERGIKVIGTKTLE